MGGLGPMQGQLNHFNRKKRTRTSGHDQPLTRLGYAPEKIPYAINRYKNETRRLFRTLDTALAASASGYLVGDKCTLADLSSWGWVAQAGQFPSDIPEKPPHMTNKHCSWFRNRYQRVSCSEEMEGSAPKAART